MATRTRRFRVLPAALTAGMCSLALARSFLRRTGLQATALLLPIVLSSCFTLGLWGFSPETERDAVTGQEEEVFAYDAQTEWSWKLFFVRVLLTPLALGLDCLTCPVQAVIYGFGDDDEKPPR